MTRGDTETNDAQAIQKRMTDIVAALKNLTAHFSLSNIKRNLYMYYIVLLLIDLHEDFPRVTGENSKNAWLMFFTSLHLPFSYQTFIKVIPAVKLCQKYPRLIFAGITSLEEIGAYAKHLDSRMKTNPWWKMYSVDRNTMIIFKISEDWSIKRDSLFAPQRQREEPQMPKDNDSSDHEDNTGNGEDMELMPPEAIYELTKALKNKIQSPF